jgi:hypothetical protein
MKILTAVALSTAISVAGWTADRDTRPAVVESPQEPAPSSSDEMARTCTAAAQKTLGQHRAKVRLEVAPCRVGSDQAPRMVVVNVGEIDLAYSPPFKLERKTGTGWRWVNRRQAFTLPLTPLKPGARGDREPIAVYRGSPHPVQLAAGLYRVIRGVTVAVGKRPAPTLQVAVRFRVTTKQT